jgi:hypothetical protein
VSFGGRDVGVNYFLWLSELGQLSARFVKQFQSCWYVTGSALRPTHLLAYESHQILVTNGTGDPE